METNNGYMLLIKNNIISAVETKQLVEKMEYQVDLATTGRTAMELIHDYRYDMILLDAYLPDMDEIVLIQHIRLHEITKNRKPVPIILFTEPDLFKYKMKKIYLEAGVNEIVMKSLLEENSMDKLVQYINE